jgi:hypothetical protein
MTSPSSDSILKYNNTSSSFEWTPFDGLLNITANNSTIVVRKSDGSYSSDTNNLSNYITDKTINISKMIAKDS